MAIIFELHGKRAVFGELGIELYFGCSVGCRNCNDPRARRMRREQWITNAQASKGYSIRPQT